MYRRHTLGAPLALCLVLAGCAAPAEPRRDQPPFFGARPLNDPASVIRPVAYRPPLDEAVADVILGRHVEQAQAAEPKQLQLPEGLPGGDAPPINLPEARPENAAARRAAIDRLYPPLPPPAAPPQPTPGPDGRPLTLADLQRLGVANSPVLRQAAAAVEAARGAALQAGLPPNPTVGYEGDTINTLGTPGYQGGFVEQKFITGNKLQLARAVAACDLRAAEIARRRAETDLATQVRGGYFAVLSAQESVKANAALARLTGTTYDTMVDLVRRGVASPYEPAQARALALLSRAAVVQARGRLNAAWKQLAAHLGLPGLPLTEVAGRLDVPLPVFRYDAVLNRVLTTHTDLSAAANAIAQAQYGLSKARVTPVPDVNVRVMLQRDDTGPPFALNPSVAVGMPIPVWDRNQGGVAQARANLARVGDEPARASNALTATLSQAFERYESNRALLRDYRDHILPDQVRYYRGVYARYHSAPPGGDVPNYGDVVAATQALNDAVTRYLEVLAQSWQAVVDVADLLQVEDLFQAADGLECVAPLPLDGLACPPR